MFVLYGLPSCAGLRSSSPWVMKVELAMCYLGLDYELKQPDILRIPFAVPTPKVPCLIVNGEPIGESERILAVVEQLAGPSSSYPCLFDEDQVRGTAFVRLVEDHLFLIISAVKHFDAQASAVMWSTMLPNHNYLSRWLVRKYVQIVQTRRFKCTSIGGLTEDELREEALKDIRALAGQLGSSRFIAGDNLTIYDFSVAAHIASIFYWKIDNWLTGLFKEYVIFDQYLKRVAEAVGGFDYEMQEFSLERAL